MGYSTDFKGRLELRSGTTVEELRKLKTFLGVDCREVDELMHYKLNYIDLQLTDDLSALEWNGAEKTYYMERAVGMIVEQMRKAFPEFTLSGTLQAQGEDADDRWDLVCEDGSVRIVKYRMVGEKVECPNCEHEFVPGGKFEPECS